MGSGVSFKQGLDIFSATFQRRTLSPSNRTLPQYRLSLYEMENLLLLFLKLHVLMMVMYPFASCIRCNMNLRVLRFYRNNVWYTIRLQDGTSLHNKLENFSLDFALGEDDVGVFHRQSWHIRDSGFRACRRTSRCEYGDNNLEGTPDRCDDIIVSVVCCLRH